MQPLKSFWKEPPSKPATFEQERTQKPRGETFSTLHLPINDIPTFFKFLQKKVSRLDKKAPAHFYTILGLVICKNHVARPLLSFNKCRKYFLSSLEIIFCRNLKNFGMSFQANVMLRQSRLQASRASHAQKSRGLRVVLSKNFSRATFFVFWVTYLVDIYLSYLPMKQI